MHNKITINGEQVTVETKGITKSVEIQTFTYLGDCYSRAKGTLTSHGGEYPPFFKVTDPQAKCDTHYICQCGCTTFKLAHNKELQLQAICANCDRSDLAY